jgi:hypothetical protein
MVSANNNSWRTGGGWKSLINILIYIHNRGESEYKKNKNLNQSAQSRGGGNRLMSQESSRAKEVNVNGFAEIAAQQLVSVLRSHYMPGWVNQNVSKRGGKCAHSTHKSRIYDKNKDFDDLQSTREVCALRPRLAVPSQQPIQKCAREAFFLLFR